jgi:oligogalacturonide lyase
MTRHALLAMVPVLAAAVIVHAAMRDDPPREWIEPATGHRVVRLSDQPGTASLYFHQNPYTATGDKMAVSTPQGLGTITLVTRENKALLEGRVSHLVVRRAGSRAEPGA